MHNDEERRSGALGLLCSEQDFTDSDTDDDEYDDGMSSEYDSSSDVLCRQSSTESILSNNEEDDDDANNNSAGYRYQKALKQGETRKKKLSSGRSASEPVGVAAGTASPANTNPQHFCSERQNSFEDRENEIQSALAEIKARHEDSLKRKKERRRSLREREIAMKRREEARNGGLKLPPISGKSMDKSSIAAAMSMQEENQTCEKGSNSISSSSSSSSSSDSGVEELGEADANEQRRTQEERKKEKKRKRKRKRKKKKKKRKKDSEEHVERARSIVDDAIAERTKIENMSLAEQGRQRVRSRHKRTKNFFQMDDRDDRRKE